MSLYSYDPTTSNNNESICIMHYYNTNSDITQSVAWIPNLEQDLLLTQLCCGPIFDLAQHRNKCRFYVIPKTQPLWLPAVVINIPVNSFMCMENLQIETTPCFCTTGKTT